MDQNLRVQVLFKTIGELTAPLKRMSNASKGLARDISATNRKLSELKRAESQIAGYKGVEARWKATGAQLKVAQERTAALRAEMAKVDGPTKRMAASLAKLEAAEHKASQRHEEEGRKLQELGTKLDRAGVNVGELGRHEQRLAQEVRDTTRQLDRQRDALARVEKAKAMRGRIRERGGSMMRGGAMATAGVTVPIVGAFIAAVPEAKQARVATAQVEASLKSMGNRSQRTLKQLQDLAGGLQDLSLFDDDDIMAQVTANMLTFRNISGSVFDRAQRAVVDYSAKTGKDLQSTTIQFSKALNDPALGMSALGKTGTLSKEWIKDNKERIAAMVASGQRAKAQGILLTEIERQYKGSGKAARDASPDAAMQQEWRTMRETMGEMAINVLPNFFREATKLMKSFNDMGPSGKNATMAILGIAAVIGPLGLLLGSLVKVITWVWGSFAWLVRIFRVGASGARPIMTFFRGFLAVLRFLIAPIQWIIRILAVVVGAVAAFLGIPVWVVLAIAAALVAAGILIYKYWDQIKAAFGAGWAWVKTAAGNAWGFIKGAFSAGMNWLSGLGLAMGQIGVNLMRGLINGIGSMLGAVKDKIMSVGGAVVGWFKEKLGIKSPSRVFASLGVYTMTGLAQGLDRGAPAPIGRIRATARGMVAAMASSSLVAAPAMASGSSLGVGPSAAVARPQGASSGVGVQHRHEYHITIKGGAGVDMREQARELFEEIKRLQESDARSSYRDEDA